MWCALLPASVVVGCVWCQEKAGLGNVRCMVSGTDLNIRCSHLLCIQVRSWEHFVWLVSFTYSFLL